MYDVDFASWKVAHMRYDNATIQQNLVTDMDSEYYVNRQIENAMAAIREELLWCLDEVRDYPRIDDDSMKLDTEVVDPTEDQFVTDSTDDYVKTTYPKEYVIRLRFSPEWRGNVAVITQYVHRFVVDSILANWFYLVKPDEAALYERNAITDSQRVVNAARQEELGNVIFRL